MKVQWNEKYNTISVYVILTFIICLVICGITVNLPVIGGWVSSFLKAASPLIWGIVIAYILNPVMMAAEKLFAKITSRKKPHPKLNRILAVIISVIALIAGITAVILIIIPQLYESIMSIINNFETYMKNLETWVNGILENYPDIQKLIDEKFEDIRAAVNNLIDDFLPKVGDIIVKIKDGALGIVGMLKNFLIGIIASIYFMLDKENFLAQFRKNTYAILPGKHVEGFFRVCTLTNRSLSGFISGKIIDSIIIGILCFLCMTFLKFNYPLLISVIVGITNIIPFFGPFFGAIPSALLLLISAPNQAFGFVMLIVFLQQLDGNVIGPKILGNTTGLSAFWVLFAILVGGGMFGFAGMVLGVPLFAVIYSLITEFIDSTLKKKGLSSDTKDYVPLRTEKKKDKSEMKSFRLYKKPQETSAALPDSDKKENSE